VTMDTRLKQFCMKVLRYAINRCGYKVAMWIFYPSCLEDVKKLNGVGRLYPYAIEKTIQLSQEDYKNFTSDFFVSRNYLEENHELCHVGEKEAWHCLCIRQHGESDGLLVVADEHGFIKYVAYLPRCK